MGLISFFKKIFSIFKSKKASQIALKVAAISNMALEVVELVANATATKADDLLVRAARNLNTSVTQIVTAANDIALDGGRQRLAAEALKIKLLELVQNGGKVKADDYVLDTIAEVLALDKTILLTAVQNAYAVYKLARG